MPNRRKDNPAFLAKKEENKPRRIWPIITAVLSALVIAGAVIAIIVISLQPKPFDEIPRTAEDAEVVLSVNGNAVPYDLYRYFFLGNKNTTDLSGMTDTEAFDALHAKALRDIAELYATYEIGASYAVTGENDAVKATYQELLLATRYGGTVMGYTLAGFGSFEAYAAYLVENNMTDAVYRLLMQESAVEYFSAALFSDTAKDTVGLSKDDILAFFRDDTMARRMTFCYIPINVYPGLTYQQAYDEAKTRAESAYYALAPIASDAEFIAKALGLTTPGVVTDSSIENGIYLGRYDSDSIFSDVVDTLFSLEVSETGELIETADGFFIIRRLASDEDYLTADTNDVTLRNTYLSNKFYELIAKKRDELVTKITLSGRLLAENKTVDMIK